MILGQSVKSIIRTPFKTVLFILLIAAVTAFACLGFGMYSSGTRLIKAADAAYTTKAIIEYIDEGYPDAERYSDVMIEELTQFDYSVLSDNENVLNFERQYNVGGFIEGYGAKTTNKPNGQMGVLRFRYRGETDYGSSCMIQEAYYNGDYTFGEGSIFYFQDFDDNNSFFNRYGLEKGHVYIGHGQFFKGYMNTDGFVIMPYSNAGAPDEKLLKFPLWDITDYFEDDAYKNKKEFDLFMAIVDSYNATDNFVNVQPTKDVKSASPFVMQQTSLLDDGESRFFTEEEYAEGAKVVVLSRYITSRMGKNVGDTISLNIYTGGEDGAFARDSFWADGVFVESDEYTIVGIFKENNSLNNLAFIPAPVGEENWMPDNPVYYTVANIKLKNGTADKYIDDIEPYLLGAMRVSVFDQGYSETIAPINAMRETAVLLTIVSGVCCLVVLILFSYLFVAKQKDAANTMIALGAGKIRTLSYLLLSALIVCAIASAAGSLLGYRLSEKVTEAAYQRAEQTTTVDNRYSAVYMNNDDVDFNLSFAPEIKPLAFVACGICGIALLLSLIMALISLKRSAPKGGKAPGSFIGRALYSAELAVRSILRGGAKNIIVPAVSMVLIIFIGIFARQISTSNDRINDIYDNTSVYAYYTTSNGKRIDTISLVDEDFKQLEEDEHIDEIYRSSNRFMQISAYKKADSENWIDTEEGCPNIPSGSFALETFINNLVNYDKVIFTESISHTPEFLFETEMYIDYLEGYSEECFRCDECVCAMPSTYMQQHGYELGDSVTVCVFTSADEKISILKYDALIVGSFEKVSSRNNVYMPLVFGKDRYYKCSYYYGMWQPVYMPADTPQEILDQFVSYELIEAQYNYNSVSMKLKNLRTLNEFKDSLSEMGYSPVGRIGRARMWVVVEDTFLNTSIVSVNRHISYMAILFIVVYILAVAIGFVLSYLLTKSRRSELAMMRSMGTGRIRTFNIFFLEQLILSLLGGILGAAVLWIVYHEILKLQWLGFAGYFVCYWIGVVISTIIMNRVDIIKMLSAKD